MICQSEVVVDCLRAADETDLGACEHAIVGQLLEHSRIFIFENAGQPKIYMGSADWMQRNLDRRVELVFPIEDERLKARALEIIEIMLSDTMNTRIGQSDTSYVLIDRRGKKLVNCQHEFAVMAKNSAEEKQEATYELTIKPNTAQEE